MARALIVLSPSDRHLFRRCNHVSHLILHLLEIIHKFVLALVLYVTHLFTDLLLQGSVALRLNCLEFAVYQYKGLIS